MFQDLYDHMAWADAIVWRAVRAHDGAANDERVLDWLLHLHMTQRAFLLIWQNEELKFPDRASFKNASDIEAYGREYHEQVAPWLATVADDALDTPMVMPWAKRFANGAAPTVLRDTLLQVPLHSLHHRAQVNARLRELGAAPPLVDYIAWIWMGKPRPQWSAVTS
jgi:uncharacterized damage-inducible protein DinB